MRARVPRSYPAPECSSTENALRNLQQQSGSLWSDSCTTIRRWMSRNFGFWGLLDRTLGVGGIVVGPILRPHARDQHLKYQSDLFDKWIGRLNGLGGLWKYGNRYR